MNPAPSIPSRAASGRWLGAWGLLAVGVFCTLAQEIDFTAEIEPLLEEYCFDCHADGMAKGGLELDLYRFDPSLLHDTDTWLSAWRRLDSGLMPPPGKAQPTTEERRQIQEWILWGAFRLDPLRPDPGRVTLRRLNRLEYEYTIRDWLGVHYATAETFPPDDTGYSFDTIGDALSLSPLQMEKYMDAAQDIVAAFLAKAGPSLPATPGSAERPQPAGGTFGQARVIEGGQPLDFLKPEEGALETAASREAYARRVVRVLVEQAFRRPADEQTVDELLALAFDPSGVSEPNWGDGFGTVLTALLCSPRFLFRVEPPIESAAAADVVLLDEHALAARLSYFLWSSLPDRELFELARSNSLRANLESQVDRLIADNRSRRFVESFVGQWLRTRDVEILPMDARRVLGVRSSDEARKSFNGRVRAAMRQETELFVAHLLREDRGLRELVTARYTFLNEPLARFYGIPGVSGGQMRLVDLPDDSVRGGVLTQGSFLLVTSNPTRTSPVKRGQFVLDNLLGMPAPPPPPDVPELPSSTTGEGAAATMRERLAIHREDPLCASCHDRMDPLGLAFESFNALGMYREEEGGVPIRSDGQLITGESFADHHELAELLATSRCRDLYRCITEKVLIYALGRGLEYPDVPTIDRIARELEQGDAGLRSLVQAVVASPPFQMVRAEEFRSAAVDPGDRPQRMSR